MKLIYISTGYNTGIVLPISDMDIIERIQYVKHSGYNTLESPEIDTEQKCMMQIIDSHEIGKKSRRAEAIEDAKKDLEQNQKHLDYLESLK